jgi:hypothetical protein
MLNQGQCPKCNHRVLHVRVESAIATFDGDNRGRVLTFSCIHCNTVIGAQMDHRAKPRPKRAQTPAAE